MKVNDLRQYTNEELQTMIADNRRALVELKFNNKISPVENPARIRELKKDIARMHTIIREREMDTTPAAPEEQSA